MRAPFREITRVAEKLYYSHCDATKVNNPKPWHLLESEAKTIWEDVAQTAFAEIWSQNGKV